MESSNVSASSSPSASDEDRTLLEKEITIFTTEPKLHGDSSGPELEDVYFYTIRGVENLLVYTWIAKDICWTTYSSDWMFFVVLSLVFSGLIVAKSIFELDFEDVWHRIAEFLWLFSNFWWLSGDMHAYYYPNDTEFANIRYTQAARIFQATMGWLAVYYVFLKPFDVKISNTIRSRDIQYESIGLRPRFTYFESWRQYENVHIIFWIGKDYAWLTENQVMWVIFSIPTLVIAFDFALSTGYAQNMTIDHCHYIAQLLWVIANIVWAFSELFLPAYLDNPANLWSFDSYDLNSPRWYSSWILVFAYIPLAFLLFIWVPLMLWASHYKSGSEFMGRNSHLVLRVPPAGGYVMKTVSEESDCC